MKVNVHGTDRCVGHRNIHCESEKQEAQLVLGQPTVRWYFWEGT